MQQRALCKSGCESEETGKERKTRDKKLVKDESGTWLQWETKQEKKYKRSLKKESNSERERSQLTEC